MHHFCFIDNWLHIPIIDDELFFPQSRVISTSYIYVQCYTQLVQHNSQLLSVGNPQSSTLMQFTTVLTQYAMHDLQLPFVPQVSMHVYHCLSCLVFFTCLICISYFNSLPCLLLSCLLIAQKSSFPLRHMLKVGSKSQSQFCSNSKGLQIVEQLLM